MVLFGSKFKVQIPSPKSPADFRIKTLNSQFLDSSSPFGSVNSSTTQKNVSTPQALVGCLSAGEIELSEEYTRVISRGPNPKITDMHDNCIAENCYAVVRLPGKMKEHNRSSMENFLSLRHACKQNLKRGKDIYVYRGEKGFCSRECRSQEMLYDGVENPELG